jgi:hypothetical protein
MVQNFTSYCGDETGPMDNAPFTVTGWRADGGVINKPKGGYFSSSFDNYVADILENNANFPHLSVAGVPSNTDAATQAASRTNPSRPYVDIPVSVLELGDVAMLLRDLGRNVYTRAASTNVMYQFGIAPLVGDVVKLWNFTDQVDRRVKEITRLAGPRGLRRTVSIGSYSAQQRNLAVFCQSNIATIRKDFDVNTVVDLRAHARWKTSMPPQDLLVPHTMRALARQAVLGLTVDFSTLWELIPWSWLIDWGSNVGTYLKASRNIIPAELSGAVRVMRHTRTRYSCSALEGLTTMSPIIFDRWSKTRGLASVAPIAYLPFLDGRQMGIVASLSVLRTGAMSRPVRF